MSQFISHFGVCRFERIKRLRPVEPSACRLRELGQVSLTLVQRLQPESQRVDPQLIESD